MNRYTVIIAGLLLCVSMETRAAYPTVVENAIHKVERLFESLQTISEKKTGFEVSELRMDILDNYFVSILMNAPNEFPYIGYSQSDYNLDIGAERYVNTFCDLFKSHAYQNYSFRYEVLQNECKYTSGGPTYADKDDKEIMYAQIVVNKYFMKAGRNIKMFQDTLRLNLESMKITAWANGTSKYHIGDINNNGSNLNIDQMRYNAVVAYERGEFIKAYELYASIVHDYPKDGDAYYRMAVMLYKKQYPMQRRQRNRLVIDYLKKAKQLGNWSVYEKADNMLYWITC